MSGRLANLLLAGVPKAGTTSLFGYLAQHPDICGSEPKEIGYFNHFSPLSKPKRPLPPIEEYKAHFAHCTGQRYALEGTPSYAYGGPAVVDAIRELLGSPKVIITLRNPTDRLWSAYTFQRSLGNITGIRSFEEYLDACEQRRRDGTDREETSRLQGLAIGFYAEYISAWLDAFGEDIRVVFAEEMAREPERVLSELFTWLGIDAGYVSRLDMGARNVTVHARNPKAASIVYKLKRAGDRLRILPPAVRSPLRRAYLRMNSGSVPERLDAATRRRVDAIYAASSRATAEALAAHGYRELPAWLQSSSVG